MSICVSIPPSEELAWHLPFLQLVGAAVEHRMTISLHYFEVRSQSVVLDLIFALVH
jgi:hypothetical protein